MNDDSPIKSASPRGRRSKVSRFLEFLFWVAISVGTAVLLTSMSESLLPANF